MRCDGCAEDISEGNIHWAFDEPYCDTCFEDMFNYCCRCDTVISRQNTMYNSDGNPYCSECYEDDYDDDAPDNPDVSDEDREHIVRLSRSWLQGKVDYKRLISINEKDFYLKTIREKVGAVENPVYLFGLIDRDEYNVSVSENLKDKIDEAFHQYNISGIIHLDKGCNRLGLALKLRENHLPEMISIIKQITSVPEPVLQE